MAVLNAILPMQKSQDDYKGEMEGQRKKMSERISHLLALKNIPRVVKHIADFYKDVFL